MSMALLANRNNNKTDTFLNTADVAKEATSALESLMLLLSESQSHPHVGDQTRAIADVAVDRFKCVISLLGQTRTGHARFRRGPVRVMCPDPIREVPPLKKVGFGEIRVKRKCESGGSGPCRCSKKRYDIGLTKCEF